MNNLQELFEDTIKDIYNAEKQITKALPKMMKMASNPQLKEAFQMHLEQTEEQIRRLEELCKEMKIKPTGKVCHGMMGVIEEGAEHLKEGKPSPVMDAALIMSAQKVEHYEICSYGTVIQWAQRLGLDNAVNLLKQTMSEEENTDQKLTQLAESQVNEQAQQFQGEEKSSRSGSRRSNSKSSGGRASSSRSSGTRSGSSRSSRSKAGAGK